MAETLYERKAELAAIAGAVEEATVGDGGVLLIEGEPGIGKTALLGASGRAAEAAGMSVLTARAGELEREFGFGLVRQLFEPLARDPGGGEVFAGQARLGARVLGIELDGPGPGRPIEPVFPAVHGLYWMTLNLIDRGPLALLVDDAQWADRASLRFLAYLAPRLRELPLLVAVTARPGEEGDRLRHLLGDPLVLEPDRLSARATAAVVRSLAPQADDEVCAACHAATGGNAFYVREFAAGIRDREPSGFEGWSPDRLTRAVAGRIATLEPAAREVARACAILADGAALHRVATLSGLADDAARAALDSLRAGGILAPSERIEFAHPIVRAAVEASIPPGVRATSHAQAARLEAAAGSSAERVAAHLLATDPAEDPWVCERLVQAAREARSRGAPEAAASYLERAVAEPPPAPDMPRLLLELGTAEAFAFRSGAAAHVRQGFELARDPDVRLQAALLHAHVSLQAGRGEAALEPLSRVLAESEPGSARALTIEGFTANFTRAQLSARRAAQPIVDRLRERAEVDLDADPAVLIAIGAELAMAGVERERAVGLAGAGLERLAAIPPLARAFAGLTATRILIMADDHERVRSVLERAMEASRARGELFELTHHAVSHANLSLRAGAIAEAEADARSAYEVAREEDWPLGLPTIVHYLVEALVERGELAQAREVLGESRLDGPATGLSDMYTSNLLLFARARLSLAEGDPGAALPDLEELEIRLDGFGELNPALTPWRSTKALVLGSLGERDAARELAGRELELAREWGAPRALGIALRVAGLVGGETARLREAVDVLSDSFARLEHARALADLGDALLAQNERPEARTLLSQALELAHRCGGAALEERVRASLRALGARPRRAVLRGPEALTPSERRVAGMAAEGLSNREIAERSFVTTRTVEYHLHRAYRKLGIDKRTSLAGALERGGGEDP